MEPQKQLIDVERIFLETLTANSAKLTEPEKKFVWFVKALGNYRAVHQYSVGVLGQPDVGKSEFLKAGCGFDTNPGFNKPTVRLMQYMDAERISWFDFPGLDDVFERYVPLCLQCLGRGDIQARVHGYPHQADGLNVRFPPVFSA